MPDEIFKKRIMDSMIDPKGEPLTNDEEQHVINTVIRFMQASHDILYGRELNEQQKIEIDLFYDRFAILGITDEA